MMLHFSVIRNVENIKYADRICFDIISGCGNSLQDIYYLAGPETSSYIPPIPTQIRQMCGILQSILILRQAWSLEDAIMDACNICIRVPS